MQSQFWADTSEWMTAAEAREQARKQRERELEPGVQKSTRGQPVKTSRVIWRLYMWYSAVVLGVCDLGRLL
jgi:hypothetical protein